MFVDNGAGEENKFKVFPERLVEESAGDYLLRLESTGRFLFHGSPYSGIGELEPRKAIDSKGGEWGNDEAVYAVPAVIAVGRAILPKRDEIVGEWRISSSRDPNKPGGPEVVVSDNVNVGEGSVYVLNKTGFEENDGLHEWKIRAKVSTLAEVKVTPEDFTRMGGKIIVR